MNILTRHLGLMLAGCLLAPPLHATTAADTNQENRVLHWAGCGITKKAFMTELATAYEKKTGTKTELAGGGATRGIRDTAALTVDMGGTCRMALPETDAKELHVTLHPVGWDALTVITHKQNPITNLSTVQIRELYLGKITNWKELGGADAPIHLYVRQGRISGVGYAIRQYLFQDSQVDFVTQYVVSSSGPLEKAVETDPLAIGITGVSSARKREVNLVSIDNKEPSYENVRDGKYGLYRPLYLVSSPSPTAAVKSFIDFAQSEEGRDVLRKNGTVPYRDAPKLMGNMVVYGFGLR